MTNLLTDAWLPTIRRAKQRATVAIADIVDTHAANPIIALDWPRPDLQAACIELLTGLVTTACPPDDHHAWLDAWHHPPTPEALAAALAPIALAFDLDGPGPRFMQDREDLVSGEEPIERLLIEAPGGSTTSKNTDLLVRRNRVASLGRPAAAMALYTFQSWAPAGGAGNRTGLRGGGPMTTLVLPGRHPTLWQTIWANVPCGEPPDPADLPRIFPWLSPTRISDKGAIVTPNNAHPLQCWWGMPRRIRLDFTPLDAPLPCGLTGIPDDVAIRSWRQRPHGANYLAWGGLHPLTPTYQQKPGLERLSMHPQPGGIGYRHWLGLVLKDLEGLRQPAPAIPLWHEQRHSVIHEPARLFVAGFDLDNMKARGFVETTMPLPEAPNQAARQHQDALARQLVRSAERVASLLRSAVKAALFSPGATVPPDLALFSTLRERFWDATEPAFFAALAQPGPAPEGEQQRQWQGLLRQTSLALFDDTAPMEPDVMPLSPHHAQARRSLFFALQGFGKEGQALFTILGLPLAQSKAATAKNRAGAKPPKRGKGP